jgi:hypothetical protein
MGVVHEAVTAVALPRAMPGYGLVSSAHRARLSSGSC